MLIAYVLIMNFLLLWNPDMSLRNKMWQYRGTMSVTVSGKKCQYWQHQRPHSHSMGSTDVEFPDGSIAAAANFCRNPNRETRLWCFTIDPNTRTETCIDNF